MALFKPATDPTPNPGDLSPTAAPAEVVQPEESLRRRDRTTIASLSGAHFVNDTYANFLGPLLPLIVGKLSLTIAQAGWLGAVLTVSSCFMQPVYGYLSDRYLVRFFAVFSPLITTVFMSFIGIAPNFTVLALLLAAAGVGIASFHPQGAALIGAASRDRSGLGMSIFIGAGTLGFALAPIIAPYTVELFGLERSYFIMVPGLLAFAVLYFLIPHDPPQTVAPHSRANLKDLLLPVWRPLLILYLLVVIRSMVQIGFVHFLPLYFFQQGNDLITSGRLASLFTLFGAMGGFAGGLLSDKVGGRRVIVYSNLLAPPFLAAFFLTEGVLSAACLASGAALLLSTLPVNVVMAQKMLPQRTSIVSSLMMGFAWGMAGLAIPVVGALADRIGLGPALLLVVGLAAFGFLLSLFLPKDSATQGGTGQIACH